MISRKGVLLIVGGSLAVLLGAVANVIISWNEGIHSFVFLTICPISGCANAQRMADLGALGNHLSAMFSLIDGSLVPLALATLGLGLSSLLRAQRSAAWGWYRWLAILGLACLTLSTLKTMLQVLIAQEQVRLGFPPGIDTEILTDWLLRPPLWTSLFGFLTVLWGSFLIQKPADAQGDPAPRCV